MSGTQQTVHLRVNDAATGHPTPVRLRCTDAAGHHHAPFGRLSTFATGRGEDVGGNVLIDGLAWSYIDGACEILLPPGALRIQVCKGPEYRPLDETIDLVAGRLSLRLSIERWADLREEGRYAGDVRCHFLSPRAALMEGQAEDLAVVNVLIEQLEHRAHDGRLVASLPGIIDFSGQAPALETPGHLVVVNSMNRSPLGELALLNCHRVVYPLLVDHLGWTLGDWCGQCHRKGGLVAWSGWETPHREDWVCEGLAELILGQVDALLVTDLSWCVAGHDVLFTLWNAGLRVPLAGGSGKASNAVRLGSVRTYAQLSWGQELTYGAWIEAIRGGRTYVSSGPLLWFSVDGQEAGATVQVRAGEDRLRVRALARSLEPLECLQVLAGGEVVAEVKANGPEASFEGEVPWQGQTWLAARCWGRNATHTSPVYIQGADRPWPARPAALDRLGRWLAGYPAMIDRFEKAGCCPSAHDRQRLEKIFQQAQQAVGRVH